MYIVVAEGVIPRGNIGGGDFLYRSLNAWRRGCFLNEQVSVMSKSPPAGMLPQSGIYSCCAVVGLSSFNSL